MVGKKETETETQTERESVLNVQLTGVEVISEKGTDRRTERQRQRQ